MILAEKIARLRKRNGWSQEELAEKINVSRQAVSKWESAQTVPDLEKILTLGNLFGVTTDYLLKDEMESEEFSGTEIPAVRRLTLAGITMLFLLIAAAVAVFISCGFKSEPYKFLEKEMFDTEYGVTGMVSERQKAYRPTYVRCNIIGIVLCVLSPVPVVAGAMTGDEFLTVVTVCVLLLLVAVGAAFLVAAGIRWSGMQKILQSGDYAPAEKKRSETENALSAAYWLIATAVYLAWSFSTGDWKNTWIVWPVAGVLYAAVLNLYRLFTKNRED